MSDKKEYPNRLKRKEIAREYFKEVLDKNFMIATDDLIFMPNIIDMYANRISNISLYDVFVDLVKPETDQCRLSAINSLKRAFFVAGILYAKENPKSMDSLYRLSDRMDEDLKKDMQTIKTEMEFGSHQR